jgi:hypothetical protein
MAVGKTTAVNYAKPRFPHIYFDHEEPIPLWKEAERRGLLENTAENFVLRQRIFINHELERREAALARGGVTLFDLGAEEVEFYTLYYPASIGLTVDAEALLADELRELRSRRAEKILFLDARREVLEARRENDKLKKRGFFGHFIEKMADSKRDFFKNYPNTEFLNTDGLTSEEVGRKVVKWIKGVT